MATLIYIADPMCSWCYGFGPELVTLQNGLADVPLEIVVGGLRANNTKLMDEELLMVLKKRKYMAELGLVQQTKGARRPLLFKM